MQEGRRRAVLQKLAQMTEAPQLVPPPPGMGAPAPVAPVPFGGTRPPLQSQDKMISRTPLKTPAVNALRGQAK